MYRTIHVVQNKILKCHQRHSDRQDLRELVWQADLVAVINTDASGDVGWGATCGNTWQQGTWSIKQQGQIINWKELAGLFLALRHFRDIVRNKLVLIKCDNSCAVHSIAAQSA